jgi:hypothetical protein
MGMGRDEMNCLQLRAVVKAVITYVPRKVKIPFVPVFLGQSRFYWFLKASVLVSRKIGFGTPKVLSLSKA